MLYNHKTLFLCYNPKPTMNLNEFEESVSSASSIRDSVLIIGGDFHLPGWNWKSKRLKPNTTQARLCYKFSDCLDVNGLTQLVEEPTRNKNTLDLLLTNLPSCPAYKYYAMDLRL